MPKVSVIVPTYNREETLYNTLRSLLDQDFPDYEILVIDQTERHSQGYLRFLAALPGNVRVIPHSPPSSPGARNRGIREASADIIILVDDDVLIERKDFISEHFKYYSEMERFAVTGRVEQKEDFIGKVPSFLKSEFVQWISASKFQSRSEHEAYRAAGGNFSFRREWALQIGLYDENFIGTAWGEEYDFSLRLREQGYRIVYNPRAVLFHLNEREGGAGSRKIFNINTIYSKAHNLMYLLEKHGIRKSVYPYLFWYVYKQVLTKKEYLKTIKGISFFLIGHLFFLKGLHDGFNRGAKRLDFPKNPGEIFIDS